MSRVYEPQKPNSFSVGLAHVRHQMLIAADYLATLKFRDLDDRRSEAKNVSHLLRDQLLEDDSKRY